MLYSAAMTNAAHTSGLPNPSTGENRLFDFLRWLVTLLVVHVIIARGRHLAAALHEGNGPDDAFLVRHFGTTDRDQILARLTRALARATALEDALLACRPTEQGFSSETRGAYATQITDICRALGLDLDPARPTATRPQNSPSPCGRGLGPRSGPRLGGGVVPVTRRKLRARATGPPLSPLRPSGTEGPADAANFTLVAPRPRRDTRCTQIHTVRPARADHESPLRLSHGPGLAGAPMPNAAYIRALGGHACMISPRHT